MIEVTIYKDSDSDHIIGFHTYGHAEYADAGYDIICSAVSAIVITTVNSIERLTGEKASCRQEQEQGEIELMFDHVPNEKADLLLQSMMLGLSDIETQYGSEYLNVNTKEV